MYIHREILLQGSTYGIEDATAVMIKLRDSSSSLLRHQHIGQVTIPRACFIYQTEADFCLPLEPTEKMDGGGERTHVLGGDISMYTIGECGTYIYICSNKHKHKHKFKFKCKY